MATSAPVTLTFTAQDSTVPLANAKIKALAVDAIKMALPQLNQQLGLPSVGGTPALVLADVDAASNATLSRWLNILARDYFHQLAKAWRVKVADAASVKPVRDAGGDLDVVP